MNAYSLEKARLSSRLTQNRSILEDGHSTSFAGRRANFGKRAALPLSTPILHELNRKIFRVFSALPSLLAWIGIGLFNGDVWGQIKLADNGSSLCSIYTQSGATPAERFAARELAGHLELITGSPFYVYEAGGDLPDKAILVGSGGLAQTLCPDIAWDRLGNEEVIIRTIGQRLLLAGGSPRGTMHAVGRFLQNQCGVRWWTPWASHVPRRTTLKMPALNIRAAPAFAYREPHWYPALDGLWAARNACNGHHARLTEEMGGKLNYAGFVHTFYQLAPPQEHFHNHPEWFSLINGKRQAEHAQLCLTNPQLKDYVTMQVLRLLREQPHTDIVSVSPNDWLGACECERCRAVEASEESPAGALLEFVNAIAEKVESAFPHAAIDTLAYRHTRKAPRSIRPRQNVIVRLCAFECNYAVSLEHPANAEFARDLRAWSKICPRLYVWDYNTDYAHYLLPYPNWFTLGPNLRYYGRLGASGVFGGGAYQSHGAEMGELRAWVQAQLMWNPKQNDPALIREFLAGYYGRESARWIWEYLKVMRRAARGWNLTCFSSTDAPFLHYMILARAEQLWQKAREAAASEPENLWRVNAAHLPIRYAFLVRWAELQKECRALGGRWPFKASRKEMAEEWLAIAKGSGPRGWLPITHLNYAGLSPEEFVRQIKAESE